MNVTACLVTYRRPENVGPIVSHLLKQPFISRVLIRDNAKGDNTLAYGRFQMALLADTDVVYTQDDDCIVHDIERIYQNYVSDPACISFGLAPSHYPLWKKGDFTYKETQLAMMGWGAFFKREWILPAFDRYGLHWKHDLFFYREADRIFSMMTARHHHPILTEGLEHLPGNSEGSAMWLEANHFQSRDLAIERCLSILRGRA